MSDPEIPASCDICGALVASAEKHAAWHEQVVTEKKLGDAFADVARGARRR